MPILNHDNCYTVYCHTNIINGKKYIGITRQKPEKRWQNGYGYENTYFWNAIKKYGWDSFKHDILYSGLTKEEACNIEIELIAKYKTAEREFGYNIAAGGQTCDVLLGKSDSEHPNHQRVKMIDRETKQVIRIFGSQAGAARTLNISRKGITKACQGITATYQGYIWEYADKEYSKPVHNGQGNYDHSKMNKPIQLIEPSGEVKQFISINEAAEKTAIKRANISRYLRGMRKDSSGRRWLYAFTESKAE